MNSTRGPGPGWYPDPSGRERFWNGAEWTDRYRIPTHPRRDDTTTTQMPLARQQPGLQQPITSRIDNGFKSSRTSLSTSQRGWIGIGVVAAIAATFAVVAFIATRRDEFSYTSGYQLGRISESNYSHVDKLERVRRCMGLLMMAKTSSDKDRIDDSDFMDGCMDGMGAP